MTKLEQYKLSFVANELQVTVLALNGFVIDSCNSIFNFDGFKHKSIYPAFPVLDSYKTQFNSMLPGQRITVSQIKNNYDHRSLYFDFTFELTEVEGTQEILWYMANSTPHYEVMQKLMQERNELLIIADHTGHNQDLSNFKQRIDALSKRLEINQFLFSKIGHEIRNPLNSINGLLELYLEQNSIEQPNIYLDGIAESSLQINHLIGDLLDYAKIDSGAFRLEHIEFNIDSLVIAVVRSMQKIAQKKDVHIVLNIDAHIPEKVKGDPAKFSKLVYNLLQTTLKYTQKGVIDVNLTSNPQNHDMVLIEISFQNQGEPIHESLVPHLFDPFNIDMEQVYKLNALPGLGLYVAKQIARLHQGDITIDQDHNGLKLIVSLMLNT